MKKLLSIFAFVFLAFNACAANRVTATITVTNTPAYPNTFVFNANTRTWTNSTTASPSTGILIGASLGASATNLFNQIAAYPYSGGVSLGFSSSNVITLKGAPGQSVAASLAGTWGAVVYSTNTDTAAVVIRVPFSSEQTQSTATNNASQLASDLGTYSTNALAAGSTLVRNLVQTTGAQDLAGVKTFTDSPTVKAAQSYFEWWDTAGGADRKRAQMIMDDGDLYLTFPTDAGVFPSTNTVIFGLRTVDFRVPVSFRDGVSIFGSEVNTAAITNSTITGSTLIQTNYSTGIFGHTRANVTSLANGSNAGIDFGTKVYIKLKAGPTAAFTINGIAGGADGRMLILDNSIAQNMTIANDSGVEPTAANRIYTRTGADVTTTGQGVATLIYDSEDAHWILVSIQQ